jgi:hypothetical protein
VTAHSVVEHLVCVGQPGDVCNTMLNLDTNEIYYTGNLEGGLTPGAVIEHGKRRKAHVRDAKAGSLTVTLHGGQPNTVKVTLNATGRKLLRKFHMVPATLGVFASRAARSTSSCDTRSFTYGPTNISTSTRWQH